MDIRAPDMAGGKSAGEGAGSAAPAHGRWPLVCTAFGLMHADINAAKPFLTASPENSSLN